MPKGYTTRAKVENYMLTAVKPAFHSQIDRWIEDVEAYIDRQTGRNFVADDVASVRRFDGSGTCSLMIDDCVEVASVESPAGSEVDLEGVLEYPANAAAKKVPVSRLESLHSSFPKGRQNVRVSAKWGFSADVPGDVEMAATVLVAGIVNHANKPSGDVQSETIGRYSVTYRTDAELSDFERVKGVLKSYRKYSM